MTPSRTSKRDLPLILAIDCGQCGGSICHGARKVRDLLVLFAFSASPAAASHVSLASPHLIRYMTQSVFLGLELVDGCATQACAACKADEAKSVFVAHPGEVTLSSRVQKLSVETNLDIVDKTSKEVSEDYEITGYVSVDLTLETTAAHVSSVA